MFCNKCGRTIKGDEKVCSKCGASLGDSRFEGSGYTSVQTRHASSEPEAVGDSPYTPYTRTTYTTMDQPEKEDVLTRTTYRPILADEKKEASEEPVQAEESSEEQPAQVEIPPHEIEIEPLKPIVMKGISPDVENYIMRIKARGSAFPIFAKRAKHVDVDEDDQDEEETEKLDLNDDDDEDDDFAPPRDFSKLGKILGLAAGSVVIVALLVFGFYRLSAGFAPQAKIPGVTKSVYDAGINLILEHTTKTYRQDLMLQYKKLTEENSTEVFETLAADEAAVAALMPAEGAQENDRQFVDALLAIQKAINNASSTDYAAALASNTESAAMMAAKSDEAWKTIAETIQRLHDTTDARELSQIALNSAVEAVDVQQQVAEISATPTPAPYRSLAKGAKNEEVKKLQQRLIDLGYMTGQADGDFGSNTQISVKMFEQAMGLQTQNGIATPELQEALFSDDAPRRSPAANTAPQEQQQPSTETAAEGQQ